MQKKWNKQHHTFVSKTEKFSSFKIQRRETADDTTNSMDNKNKNENSIDIASRDFDLLPRQNEWHVNKINPQNKTSTERITSINILPVDFSLV